MINFLILGAQRSGTTSMRVYLSSHPSIYMPSTELGFFSHEYGKGYKWYISQFKDNKVVGEKCAAYLSDPKAPARVAKHLPDAKFIVLLRNPVHRVWSHYRWALNMNWETETFRSALLTNGDYGRRYGKHSGYLNRGHYAEQLEWWFSIFPRDRFHIIKSEDLFSSPAIITKQTLAFLGLQPLNLKFYHHGTVPVCATMDDRIKQQLYTHYQSHNKRLEKLLGRKFGWDE